MPKIIGYAGIVLFLLLLIGQMMPNEYHLSKTIVLKSRPVDVYSYVNDLKKWPKWASWLDQKQSIPIQYGDLTQGIGASMQWKYKYGIGRINITASSPETGVAYDVFLGRTSSRSISAIEFKVINENFIQLGWHIRGETSVPLIGAYILLYTKHNVASAMNKSLHQLKQMLDKTGSDVRGLQRSDQEFARTACRPGNNKFYQPGTAV